ncbi:MAG: hypothetical protein IJN34_08215, partial [Clostridia bacterium]|nr:hypothetical protein [Clostridia bacterium]
FPNEGVYIKPYTFTKVCDQNGRVILENRMETHTAMKENTAAVMNQMLQHAATYGTGTSGKLNSQIMGAKTGTTNNDFDRWYVGYTKYYTAGVWVGYDQPETVYYGGLNPAAVAFKKVMNQVHEGLPAKAFTPATGLAAYEVCTESGKVPTELCKTKVSGQFFTDAPPTAPCDVCGVADPNAPVVDPNAPAVDPNAPVTEPDAPETPPAATPENPPAAPETPAEPETPAPATPPTA